MSDLLSPISEPWNDVFQTQEKPVNALFSSIHMDSKRLCAAGRQGAAEGVSALVREALDVGAGKVFREAAQDQVLRADTLQTSLVRRVDQDGHRHVVGRHVAKIPDFEVIVITSRYQELRSVRRSSLIAGRFCLHHGDTRCHLFITVDEVEDGLVGT